ncbi:MAG TPA: lactate racemase domain-containing protein [Planctomycetota bacterium]|nr:lactate racemase domain-containing protein [Planctomycetota bacterium]
MPRSVVLAIENGLPLSVPDEVKCTVGREISGVAPSASEQQQRVRSALGLFPGLAAGKRRACVVVGDLSLPAPYDLILPQVVQLLVAAEIRPSRISFLVAPGNGYPVLGRGAIHRYGEEIVGEHELRAWTAAEGKHDPYFEAADLRIVVAPELPGRGALPVRESHLDLTLTLGTALRISINTVAARTLSEPYAHNFVPLEGAADVLLLSGGGSDWEETLEESLLSLHAALSTRTSNEAARTLVLAFSGKDGIGSAHFARDFYTLLQQAAEVLESSPDALTVVDSAPNEQRPYDAAATLAEALSRSARVVLFSPGLAEHSEGDELLERLAEWPALARRLLVCGREVDLWAALQAAHGSAYSLHVEPLGWRGLAEP